MIRSVGYTEPVVAVSTFDALVTLQFGLTTLEGTTMLFRLAGMQFAAAFNV